VLSSILTLSQEVLYGIPRYLAGIDVLSLSHSVNVFVEEVKFSDGTKFTHCIPRFVICQSRERSDDEMVSLLTVVVSMAGLLKFGLTRLSTRFG
jgi:hypothetical protein